MDPFEFENAGEVPGVGSSFGPDPTGIVAASPGSYDYANSFDSFEVPGAPSPDTGQGATPNNAVVYGAGD